MSTAYQIRVSSSHQHPALGRDYPTQDAAAAAVKRVMGWEEIVLSRPFPSDEGKGYAVACYPTQDALDADDTAAHVPWIVEA
jgi:hypothetical protein